MKFQAVVFVMLVAIISSTCAHIGGGSALQSVIPQVYCGRSLARALALLCFDEDGYEKRSDAGTMFGTVLLPYYKEQELHQAFPWASSSRARSMALPSRGKRYPGVVNECCDKPCSVTELISYC